MSRMGLMLIAWAISGACSQAAVPGTTPEAAATPAGTAVATTSAASTTTPAAMIACFNGPTASANTTYSMLFPAKQDGAACVCASYQYKCSKGDTSCSTAEAALGTTKYAYSWTLASTCSAMASMPDIYSNVLCCSEDQCNKPDATLDPTTKAVETSQVVSVTTAVPTQPAAAVEKAAVVEAAEDLPTATATSDSSLPAETVQMDPNAGGLPLDGMSTPHSSTVSLNGLYVAPVYVYSHKKEASTAATQSTAKSVSSADVEIVDMLVFVVVGLLALVL